MEIDTDKLIEHALRDAIREGVAKKLTDGYNGPLTKMLEAAIEKHQPMFRALLENAIGTCLNDATFTENIASAVRVALAKTLVQKFGGELEKQVNALKSDPITRARIVLALDEIVKQKTTA